MGLSDLVVAYVLHPAIWVYAALLVGGAALAMQLSAGSGWARVRQLGLPFAATVLAYPFAEYLLHRFVLHSRLLYRSPRTVALWKRIHYDHHTDPHDLRVLFGALHTTLPPIALVTLPIGLALGGPTYYPQASARPRSESVFNLGYGEAERRRYPWLAQRSAGPERERRSPAGP
jgi:hypothetical protein